MFRLSLLLLLLRRSACSTLLGWVESPGYPSGYPPHASLNWSRCAPEGHTLSLRIIHLDMEDSRDCENDAAKIFSDGNLIYTLCGQMKYEALQTEVNPSLVSSTGGCLSLSFHSDFSNPERHTGFRGFYSVNDFDECEDPDNRCTQFCHNYIGGYRCSCRHGYHLDTDRHTCTVSCSENLWGQRSGQISSPSWPHVYAENANCRYNLSVEDHLQLELHFSKAFDVEQAPDGQCVDALTIETHSGTLGPFCGRSPPPSPLLTHSHQLNIRFTSDGFGANKGFGLNFRTTGKVCASVVTSHSRVSPEAEEYLEGQTVMVTCDLGHILPTDQDGSQYETTCLKTGVWSPIFPCEPLNCGPPKIPKDGILQAIDSENLRTEFEDQIQYKCTSDYYTLEGNDTLTCGASGDWVSGDGSSHMPKCIPVCGMPRVASTLIGRIFGGRNAEPGEIPWQLLIREPARGGVTLINDQWGVTAAHVVNPPVDQHVQMYGGLVDAQKINRPDGSPVVRIESEKIIRHPGYNGQTYDNDIALIKFSSRVNLDSSLIPICLPEVGGSSEEGEMGTVAGWGYMEKPSNNSLLVVSRKLKHAQINVYPRATCQDLTNIADSAAIRFTDNMFCAGAPGKDSCKMDSGGPMFSPPLSRHPGPYRLIGIVSWGPPCEKHVFRGYYTRVENYVNWIKETIDREG